MVRATSRSHFCDDSSGLSCPHHKNGNRHMKKIITIAAMAVALIATPAFAKTTHHMHYRAYQDQEFTPYSMEYLQQFQAGGPYQAYRMRHDGNVFQSQWNDGN